VEVYLGHLAGPALAGELLTQAAWCVVLYGAARIVLAGGVRKLVIQGG
jgi:hypothetical protein